jgi:carbamoylphosphate synthase large subunit
MGFIGLALIQGWPFIIADRFTLRSLGSLVADNTTYKQC